MPRSTHRWGIKHTSDRTHEKRYLQTHVDNVEDFARPGELFLNEPLKYIYYLDTTSGEVKGLRSFPDAVVVLPEQFSFVIDASSSSTFVLTLIENRTLPNPINLESGQELTFIIKQDAYGGNILSFGSMYKFPAPPALRLDGNYVHIIKCVSDGSNLFCEVLGRKFNDSDAYTSAEYTFSTPSAEWVVNHNKGYRPNVIVVDLFDRVVLAEIQHMSTDQVRILLASPQPGKVIIN